MNELTTMEPGQAVVSYRPLLELSREVQRLIKVRLEEADKVFQFPELKVEEPETEAVRARVLIERLPPLAELQHQDHLLETALYRCATEDEVAPILAGYIEAVTNSGKAATVGWAESVLGELLDTEVEDDPQAEFMGVRGYGQAAIAIAFRRLLRSSRFFASLAELFDVLRVIRREIWMAWRVTRKLVRLRVDAEAVVRMLDPHAEDDGSEVPF